MQVVVRPVPGRQVELSLRGELAGANLQRLERWLARLARQGCDVVVDLAGLSGMDDAGRRLLRSCQVEAVTGGRRVTLRNAPATLRGPEPGVAPAGRRHL
jgi:ABC-type transporter Mla MlaB component